MFYENALKVLLGDWNLKRKEMKGSLRFPGTTSQVQPVIDNTFSYKHNNNKH